MKKTLTHLLFCLLCLGSLPVWGQGSFVLRGKALHSSEKNNQFELAVTHPFKNEGHIVGLRPDGTFEQTIPVEGTLQDVYLYLGDAVTVFTFPGDTINLEFDFRQAPAGIRVWGNTPERSRELSLCMEIYKNYRRRTLDLHQNGYRLRADQINGDTLLNQAVAFTQDMQRTIQQFKQTHGALPHEKYFYQTAYFLGLKPLVYNNNLLRKAGYQVRLYPEGADELLPYANAIFDFFSNPAALDFIQSYIFYTITRAGSLFSQNSPNMDEIDYKVADAVIPNKKLRDWYLVKKNFAYPAFSSMTKAKELGEQLLTTLEDQQARSLLEQQMKDYIYPFQPGAPARDMTLTDFDGKEISLSSLRGKYVYIDIWAEGCGPCMMEFQNTEKLHQKYAAYKNRITYLFVCATGKKENCRKIIEKYHLQDKGIHLFVDDAHQTEAKKYDLSMWPLYILIDPEGKIVEYNTARPSSLLHDTENIFDRCLKKN